MEFYIIFHVICGFVAVGISVAYFRKEYPLLDEYRKDLGHAIIFGIFGPVGLFVSFVLSGFARHGWTLREIKQ